MLPDSRSGTTRIWARPATSDLMPLILAASDGVVECQRSVQHGSSDLSAVSHLAQRGGFDSRGYLGGNCFDRGQDRDPRRRAEASLIVKIDSVLDDVALSVEIGENVDGCIGDEHR